MKADTSLNNTWYQIGKEIGGIDHHYWATWYGFDDMFFFDETIFGGSST